MKSPTPCARSSSEDQAETAKLIAKGTPVARLNTGIDGGMNKVFASKLPNGSTGLSEGGDGQGLSLLADVPRARHHPPDGQSAARPGDFAGRAAGGLDRAGCAGTRATRVAPADAGSHQSDGFFSSLARKVGLGGAGDTTATTPHSAGSRRSRRRRKPTRNARPEGSIPKTGVPNQAGGRPAAAETHGHALQRGRAAAAARARSEGQPGRRRAADRARRIRSTAASRQ